jgi:hypothetical protein
LAKYTFVASSAIALGAFCPLASVNGPHVDAAHPPPRHEWPHEPQSFASLVRSTHLFAQQFGTLPVHAVPEGALAVPHTWFMHVASTQGGGVGQSDDLLHPGMQVPSPAQAPPFSHGVNAGANVARQQPSVMHARIMQTDVGWGQSLADVHVTGPVMHTGGGPDEEALDVDVLAAELPPLPAPVPPLQEATATATSNATIALLVCLSLDGIQAAWCRPKAAPVKGYSRPIRQREREKTRLPNRSTPIAPAA